MLNDQLTIENAFHAQSCDLDLTHITKTVLPPQDLDTCKTKSQGDTPQNGLSNSPNWMSDALANLSEGNRNDTFFRLACRFNNDGLPAESIFAILKAHAERVRFDLDELHKVIVGACNRYPNDSVKPNEAALEARLQELATLSLIEYDQQRKLAADQLGLRTSTLDAEVEKRRQRSGHTANTNGLSFNDPEPWNEPVIGSVLLTSLVQTIKQFVVMPDHMPLVVALWILFTYCHDAFQISPILCVTSPEKRCGKSTLLSLLSMLVRRALSSSNITPAVIYRIIDKYHPTLIIDEADTFLAGNSDLIGILNSGHNRDMAYVLRSVGDGHEPTQFPTWAPKVIGLIGDPPTTLFDRSIISALRRRLRGEIVKRLRNNQARLLVDLRRQCLRWANDNSKLLSNSDPIIPEGLNDRAADNWAPLYSIADLVGGEWPSNTRMASIVLNHEEAEEAASIILLQDIQKIFADEKVGSIPTATLLKKLEELEDHPWAEWFRGKPITARGVAKLLKPYGIRSKDIYGGKKGYKLADFTDAFARYIPKLSANPLTQGSDSISDQTVTTKSAHQVADIFMSNLPKDNDNRGFADKTDEYREEDGEIVDEI